ncbi:MAG TPA: hypothetical protein VFE46_11920 [Pirellulales bacterium]|jgi:hypothetical protein|nr:hypothetical protein [Pirellulales bacterium]
MPELILSDAQAQVVVSTVTQIPVRNQRGTLLGYLSPVALDQDFSAEEIEAAKARLRTPGPRRPLKEIVAELQNMKRP